VSSADGSLAIGRAAGGGSGICRAFEGPGAAASESLIVTRSWPPQASIATLIAISVVQAIHNTISEIFITVPQLSFTCGQFGRKAGNGLYASAHLAPESMAIPACGARQTQAGNAQRLTP